MATLLRTNQGQISGVISAKSAPQFTTSGKCYTVFSLYREIETTNTVRTETIQLTAIGEPLAELLSALPDNQPIIIEYKLVTRAEKQSDSDKAKGLRAKEKTALLVTDIIPTLMVVAKNRGFIVGHVSNFFDPELGKSSSVPVIAAAGDHTKLTFTVGHNESNKNDNGDWIDTPYFFSFECWNGLNKVLADTDKGLTKGTLVSISYSVKQDTWKDNAGAEQARLVLNVGDISFTRKQTTANAVVPTKNTTLSADELAELPF